MHPRSGDKSRTAPSPAPCGIHQGAGAFIVARCNVQGASETATCGAIELPAEPPEWIHLMTPGQLRTNDGRSFLLEDPAKVVRNSQDRLRTMVIDYEHQTDLAEKNGQPAPAAGWIKELAVRTDGIWGRVEWTDKAAGMIRSREYRYLSPTFTCSKAAPHRVGVILRAALTNDPALELTALATTQNGDPEMEFLKALAKALGLGEDATEEQVLAALKSQNEAIAAQTALATAIKTALGLDEKADETAIAEAVKGLKDSVATAKSDKTPDPAKFVPVEQVAALSEEIAQLKTQVGEDKAAAAVEDAMKSGKLPPALKDWGLAYATSDLTGFTNYCEKQPVIVKPGTDIPADPTPAEGQLTQADKALCKQMGIPEDEFLKTRKKELEASA